MDPDTNTAPRAPARRLGRGALLATAVLAGTACTPQYSINAIFGDRPGEAARVADCESHMDPNAVSPTDDHGLFQINAVHRAEFERVTGQPWAAVYEPFWNTRYARHLFDQQGWGPWTCAYAAA